MSHSDNILDETDYLRIRVALQTKEIFELKFKEAQKAIEASLREAFTKAGLDPDKVYEINHVTRAVQEVKS